MPRGENTTKTILVEIDCLLDTRLALLETLHEDAVDTVLKNDYLSRDRDDYEILTKGLIDQDTFINAYANRDKTVLEKARPTMIIDFLRAIIMELDYQKSTTPYVERVKVAVNYFPYKLSEEEKDVICLSVGHYLPKETWVETVSISPMNLLPSVIGESYEGVIMYNFDGWFIEHAKTLDTTAIPQNKIYAPAFFVKDYTEEELEEVDRELKELNLENPFEYLEMAIGSRVDLELLRAELFSIKSSLIVEK